MAAPLATITGMNALQMDSEFDRRTGANKTWPKNWYRQFARKVGPSDDSVRYSSTR